MTLLLLTMASVLLLAHAVTTANALTAELVTVPVPTNKR